MIQSTTLPAEPASAAAARAMVGAVVTASEAAERAILLTSELVSNVVLHARTEVELTVRRDAGVVRVEVGDHNPAAMPIVKDYDRTAVTGRGLQLVAALADRWGVETSDVGKVVWFEIALEER
jgi:anti-sigma regulatory factor (Ser/Thr protein kinase)